MKVRLEDVSSVVDESVRAVATATTRTAGRRGVRTTSWNADLERPLGGRFEFVETLLRELDAALRELNAWILVDQLLVELAEAFILLIDCPTFFSIEGHLN